MSRSTKWLLAVVVIVLLLGIFFLPVRDWALGPRTPETILDAIVEEGEHKYVHLLGNEYVPLDFLIEHLSDHRKIRRPVRAVHGPYTVWMMCRFVLADRLGLGKDPDYRYKTALPWPDAFDQPDSLITWWRELDTHDELVLRHRLATWQLAEMEAGHGGPAVKDNIAFKRRQVDETASLLQQR